ncbi:MAG: Rrf2 family transcriptional regulator [Pseudomonadota bacterium]|nr:Rrf2 family transcriptional regulator [Pseudomonadota bacterium]
MQLSTKGRYAVMAMTDLARHEQGRAVALADIAARQQLSLSYLEQLFARLRRGGLVRSVRGPGGGYRLARTAAETRVVDIVCAVDEPLHVVRCEGAKGCMLAGERCLTHDLWDALGQTIHDFLAGVSLADVIERRVSATPGPTSARPGARAGMAA